MVVMDRQHYALQTIFSFFLGLIVLAFVGVGVNTFYPSPSDKYVKERQETSRRHEALNRQAVPGSYTAAQQEQFDSLAAEEIALNEKQQAEMKEWARVTSIVLVLFATLVLVVSLIRSEQLRVISNGLLLGGLFTMVYGAGMVIFSGNSLARFWVILFALIVAVGLGYLKFVRRKQERTARAESGAAADEAALGALSARVTALEERAAAAAAALSGGAADRVETGRRD